MDKVKYLTMDEPTISELTKDMFDPISPMREIFMPEGSNSEKVYVNWFTMKFTHYKMAKQIVNICNNWDVPDGYQILIDGSLFVTIRRWNDQTKQWEDDAKLKPTEEGFDLDDELLELDKFLSENFKKNATDNDPEHEREYLCSKDKPVCEHEWEAYYGLSNIAQYDYCGKCGEKKDD